MGTEIGPARAVAAAIALIGWVGLAVQFNATFEQNGSVVGSLWILLRYFTVLTNLLVAVVMTGIALGKSRFGSALILGGATLAIVLVGVIYSVLLRGLLELSGGAKLADFILHDVVPVLVPLFWLVFAQKGALQIRQLLIWAIYPLAYLAYALTRGTAENKYPYPFMDAGQIGWHQTAINSLLILLGFMAAGFVLVGLDRLLARRSRKH